MTKKRSFKRLVREEMKRTGKSYAAARRRFTGTNREPASVYEALITWSECLQAVGWDPFTVSTEEQISMFSESASASIEEYALDCASRLIAEGAKKVDSRDQVLELVRASIAAAASRDVDGCMKRLRQADVLLTQQGWVPPIVRWGAEWLGSDFEAEVPEPGEEATVVMIEKGKPRELPLSSTDVYRVRGDSSQASLAGRRCRLRRLDHFSASAALVQFLDDDRFAVVDLSRLELDVA